MATKQEKIKADIRAMMKKQRQEKCTNVKRVESPLAKYNSLGQLTCVVCNIQIKSEIIWNAHIQGKKHRQNVEELKSGRTKVKAMKLTSQQPVEEEKSSPSALKRKGSHPEEQPVPQKKTANITPPVDPVPTMSKERDGRKKHKHKHKHKHKTRESSTPHTGEKLPEGFFDDAKSANASHARGTGSKPRTPSVKGRLPDGFFDGSSTDASPAESSGSKPSTKSPSSMKEKLPEGFFDDATVDAKVRQVEVKNTAAEEWAKFQKEMEQQQQASRVMEEADDEATQVSRNITEIDEQIQRFANVEKLRDKQDEWKSEKLGKPGASNLESGTSDDEEEYAEFMDWRSKGAFR